ncbi:MAG: 30S ribosomal protein S12 methylthiotransferase RimO [Bacteroidales bacterium]|nr:30S ribosomal protein S12 methylthiotransferase RimO [Bacteroidales bacterium]
MQVNSDKKKDFINVVTLGCSKNTVDSEVLMRQLEANNLKVLHNEDSFAAKTVIINTCGFISDAKQESIDTILQFLKAKEKGLIKRVLVIGCLSERYKKDLEKEIPDVDKYFGVNDLKDIIKYLNLNFIKDLTTERYCTTPSHYAYLKISEGCDRKCAFCAIPMIRGRHRSKSMDVLMREAEYFADRGVKELILIAQDLTSYGLDLYKRPALTDLLSKLSEFESFQWIRLHYAYPAGFPKEIIPVIKTKNNVCRYIDVPVQHASNKLLKLMRRGYSLEQFTELISHIRSEIPDVTIRTTILTGHPGEGEKEFLELLEFIERMKFERLGVFKYSEEEGTYGRDHYPDLVSEKEKSERVNEIMNLQASIYKKLNYNKINNSFKVLIDSRGGEYYIGRTEADSPEVDQEVLIPVSCGEFKTGNFYDITITDAEEYDLFGVPFRRN